MPADVNVTEKVARAIHAAVVADLAGRGEDPSEAADWIEWLGEADAALSALADPEVLTGIAGVVANFTIEVRTGRGVVVASIGPEQGALLTAAVVEWLRGRA